MFPMFCIPFKFDSNAEGGTEYAISSKIAQKEQVHPLTPRDWRGLPAAHV